MQLYALICERLDISSEAISALRSATTNYEAQFEETESSESEERYIVSLCNLARVLLASHAYEEALEAYQNCLGLLEGREDEAGRQMRLQCLLGKAIGEFWTEKVEDSLEDFERCLEICDQAERGEVTVLLARTLWGLGGEDAKEAAKSHLLEWCVSIS